MSRFKKLLSAFSKVREQRKCQITGKQFSVSDSEKDLYRKHGLPTPLISPEEAIRRKLAFVSSGKFYRRTCDKSAEIIESVYPQNTQFPVYKASIWWSREFDATEYGREFSFDKMFVEQMLELWRVVPRPSFISTNYDSCNYVHYVDGATSCSHLLLCSDVINCHYGHFLNKCRNCWDSYHLTSCDGCYECIHCESCLKLVYSEYCMNCVDSYFLSNCRNCRNCIFCSNIDGGEFMIRNKKVSKDEYYGFLSRLELNNRSEFETAISNFNSHVSTHPLPYLVGDIVGKNTGNYLWNCKDCHSSYDCHNCSKVFHCESMIDATECLDGVGYGRNSKMLAQFALLGDRAENIRNSVDCWNNVSNLDYCSHCEDSNNLFACVGLRKKSFCIFNKQYSENEYLTLRKRIIDHLKYHKHWGHFFTPGFCGLAYNVSAAQVFMPLSRAPAKLMGFRWDDEQENVGAADLLLEANSGSGLVLQAVPEEINQLEALADKSIFVCEISAEAIEFSPQEIALYKEFNIAPPRRAAFQRHLDRISRMNRKRVETIEEMNKFSFRSLSKKQDIIKRV